MKVLSIDNPDKSLYRDYLGLIIAAAGGSSRFGPANKLLQYYLGIPLFVHSLLNFKSLCQPENLILITPREQLDEFRKYTKQFLPDCEVKFVIGGETRTMSVKNGLDALDDTIRYVAIHDAARPLAAADLLLQCLTKAEAIQGGAVPAKPVADTLRRVNERGILKETVSRDNLWRMETPQVFNLIALRDAFGRVIASQQNFTDDAAIMGHAGYPVAIVPHHQNNLKVTYPEDIAELPVERGLN